jgi:sodium/potassium-transporting ATPase subunit alpha
MIDIGIAMNLSSNDVVKEEANVIFMNDDFCSIITGIEEGRLFFDNLIKTISYSLSHLVPEFIPILFYLAFSLPLGINSLLILTIDLGIELIPTMSLAYEKMESDILLIKPRNTITDKLFLRNLLIYAYCIAGLVNCSICIATYFYVFSYYEIYPSDIYNSASNIFNKNQIYKIYH